MTGEPYPDRTALTTEVIAVDGAFRFAAIPGILVC